MEIKLKTLGEIVLPTHLLNLHIKKYSNILQSVKILIFLNASIVLLKNNRFEASARN